MKSNEGSLWDSWNTVKQANACMSILKEEKGKIIEILFNETVAKNF